MFKRIKEYFAKRKKRKHLQKLINHEVLEVLVSICVYLDIEGRRTHNYGGRTMENHYCALKEFSGILRDEIIAEKNRNDKRKPRNDE